MDLPNTTSYSEFRENLAGHFRKLKKAKRPTVVLQKGKIAAVVLGPSDFEDYAAARETLDILNAIEQGRREHAEGKTILWARAKKELLARFERRSSRAAG